MTTGGRASVDAGRGPLTSRRTGLHKDYLDGLDHLRHNIQDIESELDKTKLRFFHAKRNDEEQYEKYLTGVSGKLHTVSSKLKKKASKAEVIDSDVRLMALLNKARELSDDLDPKVIEALTAFWKNLQETLEVLKGILTNFRNLVLKKLLSSCLSYQSNSITLELTMKYGEEVRTYQRGLKDTIRQTEELMKSYEGGIKHELFTNTNFISHVMAGSDQRMYPVLRLVPDLAEKVTAVCRLARQWVDKDETYMHDLTRQIRVARNQTKKKTLEIHNEKEKYGQLSKSVDEAHAVFKESKKKLKAIEKDLKSIEAQVEHRSEAEKYRSDEKKQKESIVGFLDISIAQTKKNYSLQLKRSRMLRQLRELEQSLQDIEMELQAMETEMQAKTSERDVAAKQHEEVAAQYRALKQDLDQFTHNVEQLQQELADLTTGLSQLEIIQTFKTSPEKVEDFYDRPASVKLAPSLKEKIKRKRKLTSSIEQ